MSIMRSGLFTALIVAVATSGCAALNDYPPDRLRLLDPSDSLIAFTHPKLESLEIKAVRYRDQWQVEEYIIAEGMPDDWRTEAVMMLSDQTEQVALNFRMLTSDAPKVWTYLSEGDVAWTMTDSELLQAPFAALSYRTFTSKGGKRPCVSFAGNWAPRKEDLRHRPTRALIGYICAPAGVTLDGEAIDALMTEIRIREKPVKSLREQGIASDLAIALAKGGTYAGDTGSPAFPFRLAEYYTLQGGDDNLRR